VSEGSQFDCKNRTATAVAVYTLQLSKSVSLGMLTELICVVVWVSVYRRGVRVLVK
jgi:hypothetical protein